MEKIIYIKLTQNFENSTKHKLLLFIQKIVFNFKRIFNIVTKKNINKNSMWVLPYIDNIRKSKLEKIIKKEMKNIGSNSILVLSKDLKNKEVLEVLNRYNIKYITGNLAKKELVFKVIEYINRLQNTKINEREITLLANKNIKTNIDIIENFAIESKAIKIVSKQINNFKILEEKLYNEKGIGIQFSNNYRKSLKNTDFIINLDFNEKELNEYNINSNAIIINTEDKMKIKSKSFNGIIINSYIIHFLKTIEIIKDMDFNSFEEINIYESLLLDSDRNLINENTIKIVGIIGNNGIIPEKEFKNISQNY